MTLHNITQNTIWIHNDIIISELLGNQNQSVTVRKIINTMTKMLCISLLLFKMHNSHVKLVIC